MGSVGNSNSVGVSSSVSVAAGTGVVSVGLTREMADALSRKLSAPELKAIIALNDKLRKESAALVGVEKEKEDLVQRLQVCVCACIYVLSVRIYVCVCECVC